MINWDELQALAARLQSADIIPTGVGIGEWSRLEEALFLMLENEDDEAIIRLRLLFGFLLARDSVTGLKIVQRLELEAISSAERLRDYQNLADFLGAHGHNLHRKGYHKESIESFERAHTIYIDLDQQFNALKCYFMTSLCYRALGEGDKARTMIAQVLSSVSSGNPWRGNPLQVQAWLLQDIGKLQEAELALREALRLHAKMSGNDILIAGCLADLGEIVGLQRRFDEACACFSQSLSILARHSGQYQRQVARTKLKYGEMLINTGRPAAALALLDQADDAIRPYGTYYDLLWRIELTRGVAYLKLRDFSGALRKLRIAFRIRDELDLSNRELIRQTIRRFVRRIGLPR